MLLAEYDSGPRIGPDNATLSDLRLWLLSEYHSSGSRSGHKRCIVPNFFAEAFLATLSRRARISFSLIHQLVPSPRPTYLLAMFVVVHHVERGAIVVNQVLLDALVHAGCSRDF